MRLYKDQPSGTVTRAQQLRRQASPVERRLLRALRKAFPTHKWRHQSPIAGFFADILCFSEALVIEVDGDTHAGAAEYDAARTAAIAREGFRVVRFGNVDVMRDLEGVLAAVAGELNAVKAKGSTA